jgi:thiazolylpeptide-type bacteriocin precursor
MSQPFQPAFSDRRFDVRGNQNIDDLLGGLEGRVDRVTLPPRGLEDEPIVITDGCTSNTCITCNSCATCNTCTCTCLFCEGGAGGLGDPRTDLSGW